MANCPLLARSRHIRVRVPSREFLALPIAKAIILARAPCVTRAEGKAGIGTPGLAAYRDARALPRAPAHGGVAISGNAYKTV